MLFLLNKYYILMVKEINLSFEKHLFYAISRLLNYIAGSDRWIQFTC